MKIENILLVSDVDRNSIIPFGNEDAKLLAKYHDELTNSFSDVILSHGYWRITVRSHFFGLFKSYSFKKLEMEL